MQRNASIVQQSLFESKEHVLYTKKDAIIQFPKRFLDRGMADIGLETYVYGIYALIIDGVYAVSAISAMVKTSPQQINLVDIDGEAYYNFHYTAGSPIIDNTMVVKDKTLVYAIMDEFFLKGKMPWYVEYEDLGKIYDTAKQFTDADIAENYAVLEALAAYVTRDPDNRTIQFRHKYSPKTKPSYIGIYGNVFYAAPGTVAKLAGSYFQDGVVSALTQPAEKSSKVESLLRA